MVAPVSRVLIAKVVVLMLTAGVHGFGAVAPGDEFDYGRAPNRIWRPLGATDVNNSILGLLAPCPPHQVGGMHRHSLDPEERYLCNAVEFLLQVKEERFPNDDLCAWSFNELIPVNVDAAGNVEFKVELADFGPVAQVYFTALDLFWRLGKEYNPETILSGGGTIGLQMGQELCSLNQEEFCHLTGRDVSSHNYFSSSEVYRLNDELPTFLLQWLREFHSTGVNLVQARHWATAVSTKVVPCDQLPAELSTYDRPFDQRPHPVYSNLGEYEVLYRQWRDLKGVITQPELEAKGAPFVVDSPPYASPIMELPVAPSVAVRVEDATVTVTVTHDPQGLEAWLGISLGASQCIGAHTFIIQPDSTASERRIGDHSPGFYVKPIYTLVSDSTVDGTRTVVLTLPVGTESSSGYVVPGVGATVPIMFAVGRNTEYLFGHLTYGTFEATVM